MPSSVILIIPSNPGRKEYEVLLRIVRDKNIPVSLCSAGDRIILDSQSYFDVLSPKKGYISDNSPLNNESLVLKLLHGRSSILFTGDMESDAVIKRLKDENVIIFRTDLDGAVIMESDGKHIKVEKTVE